MHYTILNFFLRRSYHVPIKIAATFENIICIRRKIITTRRIHILYISIHIMPKHVIILCVVSTSVIDSHPSASLQCSPLSLRQRAPLLHMNSQPTLVSLEISSYQSHLPSHFHHRSLPFSFFLSFFHSHKHTLSCIPFPLSSSPPLSFFHSFSLPFTHTHTHRSITGRPSSSSTRPASSKAPRRTSAKDDK